MRILRRLAACAIGLALFASPTLAQDNGPAGALFADVAADPAAARSVLTEWFGAVPAEQEPLYIAYLQDIAADPALVAEVVARTGQPDDAAAYLSGPAQTAIEGIIFDGIRLLGSQSQLGYYVFAADTFAWVAQNRPEGCVNMLTPEPGADGVNPSLAYQNAYQATLDADEVAAILALSREALTAAVSGAPAANDFTGDQITTGLLAYQSAVTANLMAMPDPLALIAAAGNLAEAPAADVCAIGLLSLEALVGLDPPERDWAIQGVADQN